MFRKIIALSIFATIFAYHIYTRDAAGGPDKPKPGSMMEAAPLTSVPRPPAPRKDTKPTNDGRRTMDEEKKAPITSVTKDDYKLYAKSGHRSKKWDQFIEPAFQAFDGDNLATASIFLQKAYDAGCRDPLVLFRLGLFKESRGANAEAASMLGEAAAGLPKYYPSHPLSAAINKHTARALYSIERYDEALPYLTEALSLEPDDFMLLFMSGQILNQRGELDRARAVLEKATTLPPPPGIEMDAAKSLLRALADVTFKLGDLEQCAVYVEGLLKLSPADPIGQGYRQKLQEKQRKQKEQQIIDNFVK